MFRLKLYAAAMVLLSASTALGLDEEQEKVFRTFGLVDGTIFNLEELDATDGTRSFNLPIDGRIYTLDLSSHTIRSSKFSVQVQIQNGRYENFEPGASRLVKGNIRGLAGSRFVGSDANAGLSGKLVIPGKRTYFIEPVGSRLNGHGRFTHVLYRDLDVADHEIACGVIEPKTKRRSIIRTNNRESAGRRQWNSAVRSGQQSNGRSGSLLVAELAVDCDFEFFQLQGATTQDTLDRVELVVGITNDQYESQTGITHLLTTVIIRSSEPDPYSATGAFGRLEEFVNHWINEQQSVERDAAHLFTGTPPNDGIGGVAFLPGMCSPEFGFGLSRIDFNGDLACSTDLLAHELGHNWNAGHCSCPNNTMNGGLTCSNDFTVASINSIVSFANSLECLDTQTDVLLGDVNLDDVVNLLDVAPFVELLTNSEFQVEADINQDGVVDLLDVGPFVDLLGN